MMEESSTHRRTSSRDRQIRVMKIWIRIGSTGTNTQGSTTKRTTLAFTLKSSMLGLVASVVLAKSGVVDSGGSLVAPMQTCSETPLPRNARRLRRLPAINKVHKNCCTHVLGSGGRARKGVWSTVCFGQHMFFFSQERQHKP